MPRQDPRLEDIPRSVNEEVRDRTVRHLLFLTRVQNREADRILRFLDRQVLPDLLSKIERRLERIRVTGIDPGPVTTRRLQELASIINQETRIGIRAARQRVKESLTALAVDEATFERGMLAQSLPVEVELVAPSVQTLREVVTKRPMDGALLDDWFDRLDRDTQTRINQAIRLGVAEGETVPQMMRRVRGTRAANFEDGILAISRRNAETVVRSAVIHTSAQARQRVFEENRHVIKAVQWTSTLDTDTCPQCRTLDGQTFPIDKGPRPIAHGGCRCSMAPVTKSFHELGFDIDELPPSTRASMNGQVPETMTYNQWLRQQVNQGRMDLVEEALGKTRAKLFAAGGLKVSSFTNRRGQTLTLKQLRGKERDVFERLGVKA